MKKNFLEIIRQFIRCHQLLKDDGKYIVALSGGADSVSLLLILHDMGYRIEACHCNFHLRGEEADRDELFCVELCQQYGIPLHRVHFDTKTYAELHKESIELAARNLRYHYFEQLRKDLSADGICVAHHLDDSVETVLINLIRGTGIKGLKGISPRNGHILRPLLCVERADIIDYLAERKQGYVTDSTNLIDDVVRNKIRLNVLPMLKDINPAAALNIAKMSRHVSEADKVLEHYKEESYKRNFLPLGEEALSGTMHIQKGFLLGEPSLEFALYTVLDPMDFSSKTIDEIINSIDVHGKIWESPTHVLLNNRDELIVKKKGTQPFKPQRFPEAGTYILPPNSIRPNGQEVKEEKIRIILENKDQDFAPSKQHYAVTLDAEKVSFPLTIRSTETGDRFIPFGMKGSKLVSDYLTDKKKNLFKKQAQKVVTDRDGKIIWLVGERTADFCKVTDDTQHILRIEVIAIR